MTATYFRHGAGRSLAGREAEAAGKMPLTRAIAYVAREGGVTRKQARAILAQQGPCEAHHVGKYAMLCDYYNAKATPAALVEARYSGDVLGDELRDRGAQYRSKYILWALPKSWQRRQWWEELDCLRDDYDEPLPGDRRERSYFDDDPYAKNHDPRGNDRRLNGLHAMSLENLCSFDRWEPMLRRLAS